MKTALNFYTKLGLFSVKEEQSSLSGLIGGLILYPCFIWIFSKLWLGLNQDSSSIGTNALFAYIGLTEILYMTLLRETLIDKASADFSLSFVRPRLWPLFTIVSIFSRTLSRRLIYLLIYVVIMPFYVDDLSIIFFGTLRFLAFLPLLTFINSLYSLLFSCLQIRFFSINYFRPLFGKLFLIFGGVIAPLSDISAEWNKFFLYTPFCDLIFQPCYASIKGEFYQTNLSFWLLRIVGQALILNFICLGIYKYSRIHYHNFGG